MPITGVPRWIRGGRDTMKAYYRIEGISAIEIIESQQMDGKHDMSESLRNHLPVIVAVSVVGALTGAFALMQVRNGVAGMTVGTFDMLIIVVPCVIMLICSLIVAMTAKAIERSLYVTMMGICLALGLISMVVTSTWAANPDVAAALLANSGEGASLVPPANSPLIAMRNVAAYIVMPTVGCIAGAWIGSRMHPMQAAPKKRK